MALVHPLLRCIALVSMAVKDVSLLSDSFVHDGEFDEYVAETNIIRTSDAARSVVDCSRRCGSDGQCVAFYFIPDTHQCQEQRARSSNTTVEYTPKPSARYYYNPVDTPASSVSELCVANNCLRPNERCVVKSSGVEICHCEFGFEFDSSLGFCVKVCYEYSSNSSDFVEFYAKSAIPGYNSPKANVSSKEECVNYCSNNAPLFLAVEIYDNGLCCCSAVSERHAPRVYYSSSSLYNRPCLVTV